MENKTKERMHFGVAERGKMHYLEGNHKEALRHFQEAIQMTVKNQSSDVFFQHYTQCVMESLEILGHHDEVISYCEKFSEFLFEKGLDEPIIAKNYATTVERMAIQYLFKEEDDEAKKLFKKASDTMNKKMPLSNVILGWLHRGYSITEKQIRDTQHKHDYFVVRKEHINPGLAVDLPSTNSVPSL